METYNALASEAIDDLTTANVPIEEILATLDQLEAREVRDWRQVLEHVLTVRH